MKKEYIKPSSNIITLQLQENIANSQVTIIGTWIFTSSEELGNDCFDFLSTSFLPGYYSGSTKEKMQSLAYGAIDDQLFYTYVYPGQHPYGWITETVRTACDTHYMD